MKAEDIAELSRLARLAALDAPLSNHAERAVGFARRSLREDAITRAEQAVDRDYLHAAIALVLGA